MPSRKRMHAPPMRPHTPPIPRCTVPIPDRCTKMDGMSSLQHHAPPMRAAPSHTMPPRRQRNLMKLVRKLAHPGEQAQALADIWEGCAEDAVSRPPSLLLVSSLYWCLNPTYQTTCSLHSRPPFHHLPPLLRQ
jgi:hypothetical protein